MSEKSENGSSVPPLPGDAATPPEEIAPAETTDTPVTDPIELQETTTTEAGAEEGDADDTEPPGPDASVNTDSPAPSESKVEEPEPPVAAPQESETPETP